MKRKKRMTLMGVRGGSNGTRQVFNVVAHLDVVPADAEFMLMGVRFFRRCA